MSAPAPYAELLAATNYSFLRGASHPDEMIAQACSLGLAAIGIADRNSLAGIVRAHVAAKAAGVRLLVGARLVTEEGLEVACYPTDRAAYGRLTRLLTLGNRRVGKGACLLTLADVAAQAEGQAFVIAPPADWGEPWSAAAQTLIEAVGARDRFVLGVAHRFDGRDSERAEALADRARTWRIAPVAVADALYHAPERRRLADVVTCIRERTTLDAAGFAVAPNAERALRSPAEQWRLFADRPRWVTQTTTFAAQIGFRLDEIAYQYPDEVVDPGETAMQTLRRLVGVGAKERYPEGPPASVETLLVHELSIIEELGFAPYFLTVHDLVRFARGRGILCQGRGSAANSAVCFCLGVTAVDPTRIDVLFERFLSVERGEPPDIDIDFEHARREEVIQYIYEKYGRTRAGLAASVVTYRSKSAIREVAKVLGLAGDTIEALSKTVWGWSAAGVEPERVRAEVGLDPSEGRLALALELARDLCGFPRHLSQHVGGFVITRDRLDEIVPVQNAAMPGRTVVEWDKDDLDALGILKVDVLALGMLTALSRAFALIESHYRRPMELAAVPAEDPNVYDMICATDTIGVFQIESRAQMSMLPRLKPRTFYDLVIEVAIVRPGPIQGDMVHPYLRRREGREAVSYPSPALEAVLGKTLGVPLFQEQAMKIAIVAAGFTPAEADKLRRAMATFRKVGVIHAFGLRLVEGMVANGYDRSFAERCFRQIEGFGEYGFPESHAASFALLVYVSAWVKAHYPDVFLASLLYAQPMGFYAPAQLVRDARAHGVEVLPPDVNASDWEASLQPSAGGRFFGVRLGLRQIKGLNEVEAAQVLAARAEAGPFASIADLQRRARIGAGTLERLAAADAFGGLGRDRRAMLWDALALGPAPAGLFAATGEGPPDAEPAPPPLRASEEVVHDYTHLRLSLRAHPVSFFRDGFERAGVAPAERLARMRTGARVTVAGLVLVRQRPGSAKGVIFATLEDETGVVNLIVWPKVFERFRNIVLSARMLEARGRVQKEGLVLHVVADALRDLSPRLAELSDADGDFAEPYARADEVKRPSEDPRAGAPSRGDLAAARTARILPPSRDFH